MKRRGFLKLLLALPFAPKLAEAAAKTICPERIMSLDKALTGSDQTSIWLTQWSSAVRPQPTLLDFAKRYEYKHMLPVIEVLNQKNPLLQDKVWQEKNIQLGHKVSWDTKWAHEQIDLWGNK